MTVFIEMFLYLVYIVCMYMYITISCVFYVCTLTVCMICSVKGTKRKHCSHCGAQLLKKAKKCYSCGKRFGQCAFGRRNCPSCGHCNLAKMIVCHQCGHNLSDAPLAIPVGQYDNYSGLQNSCLELVGQRDGL